MERLIKLGDSWFFAKFNWGKVFFANFNGRSMLGLKGGKILIFSTKSYQILNFISQKIIKNMSAKVHIQKRNSSNYKAKV